MLIEKYSWRLIVSTAHSRLPSLSKNGGIFNFSQTTDAWKASPRDWQPDIHSIAKKWVFYVKPTVYKRALVRQPFIFKRKPNTICLVAVDAMTPAVRTAECAAILFVWDATDRPAIRLIAAVDHTTITLINRTWVWINDITCLLLFHFTEVLNFKENLY